MATFTDRDRCTTCKKDKQAYTCNRCLQVYCHTHIGEHRQELDEMLNSINRYKKQFHEMLVERRTDPVTNPCIQQINKLETQHINAIARKADKIRERIRQQTNESLDPILMNSNKLCEDIELFCKQNEYDEIKLKELNAQSNNLKQQYDLFTEQNTKICMLTDFSRPIISAHVQMPNIPEHSTWTKQGITAAGGNGQGSDLNQLNKPVGLCIDDDDETIYIVDQCNHRIIAWKKDATNGKIVAGENGQGSKRNQLDSPSAVIIDETNNALIIADTGNNRVIRWSLESDAQNKVLIKDIKCLDLAMDHLGYLYVSDTNRHEIRRLKIGDKKATLVAGGNGQGDRLNQLNTPSRFYIGENGTIYISDWGNHRVMKWIKDATEGILIAGGNGEGNKLKQLSQPNGIIVDQRGTIYLADSSNNRIISWSKDGVIEVIISRNKCETEVNQLNTPVDLAFDRQNNLYILECENHRVQKFTFKTQ